MDSNRASGQRSRGFIITDFTPANIKFKKMGCMIGGYIKNSSLTLNQDILITSKRTKHTLTTNNLYETPPSISPSIINRINNNMQNNINRKSLFYDKKFSNNNLNISKTYSSTLLFNYSIELIMKFSKEFNPNYDIILI